jgi:hypothetical protein
LDIFFKKKKGAFLMTKSRKKYSNSIEKEEKTTDFMYALIPT